jgi:hypothetical protein
VPSDCDIVGFAPDLKASVEEVKKEVPIEIKLEEPPTITTVPKADPIVADPAP